MALFTTALAAGSLNPGIAILAFILFGGGVALLTQERARRKVKRAPAPKKPKAPTPMEEFKAEVKAEFKDDEDEDEEGDLATIEDLERQFRADRDASEVVPDASVPENAAEEEPEPAVPVSAPPVVVDTSAAANDRYVAAGHVDNTLVSAYVDGEGSLPAAAVRDVAATLVVSDLARSVEFYTGMLGLVELDRSEDAVLLEGGFGRVLLCKRDDAPGKPSPLMHLALEVSDVDSAYLQLLDRGVLFHHGPRAAITGEAYEVIAASFTDPDGHGLAITEIREL